MATNYVGVAPLTNARTETGAYAQIYAGDPVPEGIRSEDLKRLVDEGYLAAAPVTTSDSEPEGPNPGTVEYVLAEVGNDKALAQVALDEENATEKPRKGLVAKLEAILTPGA